MTAIFDIETNGLYYDTTRVFCMSIKVDDEPTEVYTHRDIEGSAGTIEEGLLLLSKCDIIVGHNIINFDLPVLNKLYKFTPTFDIIDTLIVSKLKYPNLIASDMDNDKLEGKLKGSHSLKAWGYRLGNFKDSNDQWEVLTTDMVEYCRQDTEVTYTLYNKFLLNMPPKEAIRLEQEFATIINRQEKYGVYFDVDKAHQLHLDLIRERADITSEVSKVFTPLLLPDGKVKTQADYKNKFPYKDIYGSFQKLKLVEFNPSSRQHIVIWFKRWYGWIPTQETEKGNPIVNEEVLKELDYPEAKILAHYFNVNKLLGQLAEGDNAWLRMLHRDRRIHGQIDTLGAVSRRCTHSKPNMAQVPSSRAFKGHECRALFTVPKGKKLVGCDAEGLELRTLSHYMAKYDDGVYGDTVDKGNKDNGTDIHTVNQKAAGLPTRDSAKTFIYAFLYGAGDEKIGTIIGGNAKAGKAIKETFFRKIPAIKTLIESVQNQYKKNGFLKGLDGNPYYIRSAHSALNTLLQGAGALVMKYYLIELDKNLEKVYTNSGNSTTPDYEFVLNVHDEVQIECKKGVAEEIARIAVNTFDDITKLLNFRVPLRGKSEIGNSWADTH